MTLREALAIIRKVRLRTRDPGGAARKTLPEALSGRARPRLSPTEQRTGFRPLSAGAVYTEFDAIADNPTALERRLRTGGPLKP
jgi:hypothetical protein